MNKEILYPFLSIKRLSFAVDGPGITTLVAGSNCPLNCKYCLNKEILKNKKPEYINVCQLYDLVKIDDLYFKATGGGITFGGGESMFHYEFIKEFKENFGKDWKINVETSLNVPNKNITESLGFIDNYIVDIKTFDNALYLEYTGKDNTLVNENLEILLKNVPNENIFVRNPIIPNYKNKEKAKKDEIILKNLNFQNIETFKYIIR